MLNLIKHFIEKIHFKIKLREMDDIYYMTGQSCFSLFPPSFYYTHTPEEIEKITQEEFAEIREIIDKIEHSNINEF